MKSLSAIPRLSPFVAFTILITLVVCLADFTEAEVRPSYKTNTHGQENGEETLKNSLLNEVNSEQSLKGRSVDLSQQTKFANFIKDLEQVGGVEKLIKRDSDDFGKESQEVEDDTEKDGYGYDDDEYYHFDFKRNNEASSLEDKKAMQEQDLSKKAGAVSPMGAFGQPYGGMANKNDANKDETVEMLSFKETHSGAGSQDDNAANSNMAKSDMPKPLSTISSQAHKKLPGDPISSLHMSDLKENSAIDEKLKDRKDDSTGLGSASSSTESKLSESKKNEDKDTMNLKESKYDDESEKKEKLTNVKESKESLSGKSLADNLKDDKEKLKGDLKNPKVAESLKLDENMEKTSKGKDSFEEKGLKEDKENVKFSEKVDTESVKSNDFSQFSSRANFVSNENSGSSLKRPSIDEEKSSEEMSEKNIGLNDYQDDFGQKKQSIRSDDDKRFEFQSNTDDNLDEAAAVENSGKLNDYVSLPIAFEMKDDELNDMYKKQPSWGENSRVQEPRGTAYNMKGPYHLNFPQSELENTFYHKNYMKSLRRYKGFDDSSKVLGDKYEEDRSSNRDKPKETKKKKRSKEKKKKSIIFNKMGMPQEDSMLKNAYPNAHLLFPQQQQQQQQPQMPMGFSFGTKTPGSLMDKAYDLNRDKRKSSSKLEYEIKIVNQNQDNLKPAGVSKLAQKRRRKDVKVHADDPTYANKYGSSQYSRLYDMSKYDDGKMEFDHKLFKRSAPMWSERNQLEAAKQANEAARGRGAPSGYYSNRVKFGQRHMESEAKDGQMDSMDMHMNNRMMSPFNSKKDFESNFLQRSWRDSKMQPGYGQDGVKRFDDNMMGKARDNSIFLLKKDKSGERVKTLADKRDTNADLNSAQLAKLLSKDNDYIVLRKTEKNKFQKVNNADMASSLAQAKKYDIFGLNKQDSIKDVSKHARGLFVRSYRSSDQKHSSGAKSNLKKTFEKFKDLADFFKDNEQETADPQNQVQEVKDRSDIIFEDKIPDAMMMNSQMDAHGFKTKSPNTMSSISNNFKTLDQDPKKSDTRKFDEGAKDLFSLDKSNWEPTLKNVFPEAKSINSMQKNGNEIIVLDFDRNHLKTDQGNRVIMSKTPFAESSDKLYVPFGSVQKTPNPLGAQTTNPNNQNQQLEVVLNDMSLPNVMDPILNKYLEKKNDMSGVNKWQPVESDKNMYGKFSFPLGQSSQSSSSPIEEVVVNMPASQFAQLPFLFNKFSDSNKKPNQIGNGYKAVSRKSLEWSAQEAKPSKNFNQFLQDYRELSELSKEPQLTKAFKQNKKRSNEFTYFQPKDLQQISAYGNENMKKLGNLLQDLISNDDSSERQDEKNNLKDAKNVETKAGNLQEQKLNLYGIPAQWNYDGQEKLAKQALNEYLTSDASQDVNNFLLSEGMQPGNSDNDYQDELLEELSEASSQVQKLRREGVADNQLRKVMEDALPLRGKRWSAGGKSQSQKVAGESGKKSAKSSVSVDDAGVCADEKKCGVTSDDTSLSSKDDQKSKRSLKNEKPDAIDSKSTLTNVKDQTDELISSSDVLGNEETRRQKRSAERGSMRKVSNSAVENTILKTLEEDNDQSVYSPGITRKLLSIDDEETDADANTNADKDEEKDNPGDNQPNCVKNKDNKCVNPIIMNLFSGDNSKSDDDLNGESRERRSLFNAPHSNYKREIDLDESMPNDFQNFLVTSLGLDSHVTGVGSQKREIFRNSVGGVNGGGKDLDEDCALEKREVSNKENIGKRQGYKERPEFFENGAEGEKLQSGAIMEGSMGQSGSSLKAKAGEKAKAEFEEAKLPTQIRIQITKANSKEKLSPKATMAEDQESAATEVDVASKEKQFYGKNKFAPVQLTSPQKVMSLPKYRYSIDMSDSEGQDDMQRYYMYNNRRAKRKKKKHIQENPMKPIQDFKAFDQKAMEILMRRYFSDQGMAQSMNQGMNQGASRQNLPQGNHLPQVETVYNPTQETNKAQVQGYKPSLKATSLKNKNVAKAKSGFHSGDVTAFDEGIMRSFLKDNALSEKSEKEAAAKDLDSIAWKPFSSTARQDPLGQIQSPLRNYKLFGTDANSSPLKTDQLSASWKQPTTDQSKWFQAPFSNYPQAQAGQSSPLPFLGRSDQSWGMSNRENPYLKSWQKHPASSFANYMRSAKLPNTQMPQPADSWGDPYGLKKSLNDKYKLRELSETAGKNYFGGLKPGYSNNYFNKFSKPLLNGMNGVDPNVYQHGYTAKEMDYPDGLEDEYMDMYDFKQDPQYGGMFARGPARKMNEMSKYNNFMSPRNPYLGDGLDDEEELDEEYDENSDELLDEYSYLNPMQMEPMKKSRGSQKLLGDYMTAESLYTPMSPFVPREVKYDENIRPNSQHMMFADVAHEEADPFTNSMGLLKKANENSNIIGKNLIKSLSKYGYDDENNNRFNDNLMRRHLTPRAYSEAALANTGEAQKDMDLMKLKRNLIGSRFFYASSSQMPDISFMQQPQQLPPAQVFGRRNSQNVYLETRRNPLKAELRGSESEFEYESEENNKHFNGNLLNNEKDESDNGDEDAGASGDDASGAESTDASDENNENEEDVKDNLEDESDTLSEDNVLENVIGKYIMRKSVKVKPSDQVKSDEDKSEKMSADDSESHARGKRSVGYGGYPYESSEEKTQHKRAHNSNNNFNRFGRNSKNPAKAVDADINPGVTLKNLSYKKNSLNRVLAWKERQRGQNDNYQTKRSLNIFKKLSKEKETKKDENFESRTVGFEPILPNENSKYLTVSTGNSNFEKKLDLELNKYVKSKTDPNAIAETIDKKKEASEESQVGKIEGPWKIELDEKYDIKLLDQEPTDFNYDALRLGGNAAENRYMSGGDSPDLKAFLVIRKNAENSQNPTEDAYSPILESSTNEVVKVQEIRHNIDNQQKLFSNGRLKRKSIVPAASYANIMEDNRQLDEETSNNLGQQIVDAILTHVTTNTKLREVIAPALLGKSTYRQEEDEPESQKHVPTCSDYSEKVQPFLQKVLSDIEKIAEYHVRKRMCNKIDKQSKEFLQTLLVVPQKTCPMSDRSCGQTSEIPYKATCARLTCGYGEETRQRARKSFGCQATGNVRDGVCEILRKKKDTLLKLMDDYQRLSEMEKKTINVSFQYFKNELDRTNELISSLGENCCFAPATETVAAVDKPDTTERTSTIDSRWQSANVTAPSMNTKNYQSSKADTMGFEMVKSEPEISSSRDKEVHPQPQPEYSHTIAPHIQKLETPEYFDLLKSTASPTDSTTETVHPTLLTASSGAPDPLYQTTDGVYRTTETPSLPNYRKESQENVTDKSYSSSQQKSTTAVYHVEDTHNEEHKSTQKLVKSSLNSDDTDSKSPAKLTKKKESKKKRKSNYAINARDSGQIRGDSTQKSGATTPFKPSDVTLQQQSKPQQKLCLKSDGMTSLNNDNNKSSKSDSDTSNQPASEESADYESHQRLVSPSDVGSLYDTYDYDRVNDMDGRSDDVASSDDTNYSWARNVHVSSKYGPTLFPMSQKGKLDHSRFDYDDYKDYEDETTNPSSRSEYPHFPKKRSAAVDDFPEDLRKTLQSHRKFYYPDNKRRDYSNTIINFFRNHLRTSGSVPGPKLANDKGTRWKRQHSDKTLNGDDEPSDEAKTDSDEDFGPETPGLEYLTWSTMPVVRRRLNDMDLGDRFEDVATANDGMTEKKFSKG